MYLTDVDKVHELRIEIGSYKERLAASAAEVRLLRGERDRLAREVLRLEEQNGRLRGVIAACRAASR